MSDPTQPLLDAVGDETAATPADIARLRAALPADLSSVRRAPVAPPRIRAWRVPAALALLAAAAGVALALWPAPGPTTAPLSVDLATLGPDGVLDLEGLRLTAQGVGALEGTDVRPRLRWELGTVRLTETFMDSTRYRPQDLARMRNHIKGVLASVKWPSTPRALIGVAGTVTTLACMEHGLTTWDRSRIHGTRLSRRHLRSWMDRLLESTPAQRREWAAVAPDRADYLLAGACLLEEVCTTARKDSLYVSDGGVRYGLLSTY